CVLSPPVCESKAMYDGFPQPICSPQNAPSFSHSPHHQPAQLNLSLLLISALQKPANSSPQPAKILHYLRYLNQTERAATMKKEQSIPGRHLALPLPV